MRFRDARVFHLRHAHERRARLRERASIAREHEERGARVEYETLLRVHRRRLGARDPREFHVRSIDVGEEPAEVGRGDVARDGEPRRVPTRRGRDADDVRGEDRIGVGLVGGVDTDAARGGRARDALDGRESTRGSDARRANGTVGGVRGDRVRSSVLVDEKRSERGDGGSIERERRGKRSAESMTQRRDQRLLQPNGAERREPERRERRVLVRERGGRVETERVSNRRVQSVVDRERRVAIVDDSSRRVVVGVRRRSDGGEDERGDVGDGGMVEDERRGEADAERAFHRRVRRRRAGRGETGSHQRGVVGDVRRRARVDQNATNLREDGRRGYGRRRRRVRTRNRRERRVEILDVEIDATRGAKGVGGERDARRQRASGRRDCPRGDRLVDAIEGGLLRAQNPLVVEVARDRARVVLGADGDGDGARAGNLRDVTRVDDDDGDDDRRGDGRDVRDEIVRSNLRRGPDDRAPPANVAAAEKRGDGTEIVRVVRHDEEPRRILRRPRRRDARRDGKTPRGRTNILLGSAAAAARGDGASRERASLGEFSELALEDLSAGVCRELGQDVHARGHLVPRERSTTVSDDVLLVFFASRGVRAECHRRLHDLAHDGMRHAERRRLRHRGVRVQRGFHLRAVDVLPADENHILLPIDEHDVPIGSNRREIARVEPTVLVEALRVSVRAAPVPAENRRPADPNFPDLGLVSVAGRERANLATRRRVRHANVDERERSTGRADAIELFVVTGDSSRLV